MKTKIEWTNGGHTWNPIKARLKADTLVKLANGGSRLVPAGKVGYYCQRISPGCEACYAEAMNGRMLPSWGTGLDYTVPNLDKVEIFLDEDVLMHPLKWKKPTTAFVCSMTDWCADFVTDEMRDRMMADDEGEIQDKTIVQKLFDEIAPRYSDRPGRRHWSGHGSSAQHSRRWS